MRKAVNVIDDTYDMLCQIKSHPSMKQLRMMIKALCIRERLFGNNNNPCNTIHT